jgi:hypothetical protein
MQIRVIKPFRWAHDGVTITDYEPGETHDLEESVAARAARNGWVEPVENKNTGAAPENKAKRTTRAKKDADSV